MNGPMSYHYNARSSLSCLRVIGYFDYVLLFCKLLPSYAVPRANFYERAWFGNVFVRSIGSSICDCVTGVLHWLENRNHWKTSVAHVETIENCRSVALALLHSHHSDFSEQDFSASIVFWVHTWDCRRYGYLLLPFLFASIRMNYLSVNGKSE